MRGGFSAMPERSRKGFNPVLPRTRSSDCVFGVVASQRTRPATGGDTAMSDLTTHEFSPGLAGVPAAKSKISFVDGQTGLLEYRGIRIEELAAPSSFMETT